MDLRQIGRVARYLLDTSSAAPSREALERSAVSRYYFEAHHESRRFLEQRGHAIPRRGTHQFVTDRVARDSANVAAMLDALFQRRNRAEYEIEDAWRSEVVAEAERAVEEIRVTLAALDS